jgi:NAD(P)-dependent dehydrogenase (short-subunit alcohol dehydrogenase family)
MDVDNSSSIKQQRTAIVTGSSSGIGLETSLLLSRNRIYTYATMRDLVKSREVLDVATKEDLPLRTLYLDVTNKKSIQEAVDLVLKERKRIDILINNAGYSLVGAFEQLSIDEIKEEFDTNFFGAIELMQRILPIMRKQRSGRIVNISSVAGRIGFPLSSAYVGSKFALEGLSESLKYEVDDFGIKVILIEPGVIKTNFDKNLKIGKRVSISENSTDKGTSPYVKITQKRISAFKPRFEKGSSPHEVADTILGTVTSAAPHFRNLVGEDAHKLMYMKRIVSHEEFGKIVMKSVLGE